MTTEQGGGFILRNEVVSLQFPMILPSGRFWFLELVGVAATTTLATHDHTQ